MSLWLTCEETGAFLSDYLDGALPLRGLLKVKAHLWHCPECRALLATLRVLPDLAHRAMAEDGFRAESQAALQGALARIREMEAHEKQGTSPAPRAWPRTPVPQEAQALLDAGADLPLLILASTHQTLTRERVPPAFAQHLPQATLDQLPPETQWAWETDADGLRRAELLTDPQGGQRLFLVHAPPGSRLASHRHLGSESILVLEGAMEDEGVTSVAGAWLHHGRGSSHGPSVPACGCWYLVREEGSVRFRGPSGWLRNLHEAC